MKKYKLKTPYQIKGSYDWGQLYPLGCLEVLQGQTTLLDTSVLLRAMPLMAPAYEKMTCRVLHFYVPFRILWDKFDEFISGQETLAFPKARFANDDYSKTLLDYFGLPTDFSAGTGTSYSADYSFLPLLAYHKIWSEHFRDEEIQTEFDYDTAFDTFQNSVTSSTPIGKDSPLLQLRRVNWGSDRFTRALTALEANPDILIPIASNGKPITMASEVGGFKLAISNNNLIGPGGGSGNNITWGETGLTGFSTAEFKLAQALYNFKVNEAKYGKSYDNYRKKYGLSQIDARLQKSEVIGGFSDVIQISDVIGTGDNNLGAQGGNALGFARGKRKFKHYSPEHGLIITLMYIRPKATYAQGAKRFWLKRDMLDFFQAEFKDVGYQPIYQGELQINNTAGNAEAQYDPFGYEPRYEEYRTETSFVCGELKPNKPLDHWANPRVWAKDSKPVLNSSFLECNPTNSIWASGNTDKFIGYVNHNVTKISFVPPTSDPKFVM